MGARVFDCSFSLRYFCVIDHYQVLWSSGEFSSARPGGDRRLVARQRITVFSLQETILQHCLQRSFSAASDVIPVCGGAIEDNPSNRSERGMAVHPGGDKVEDAGTRTHSCGGGVIESEATCKPCMLGKAEGSEGAWRQAAVLYGSGCHRLCLQVNEVRSMPQAAICDVPLLGTLSSGV